MKKNNKYCRICLNKVDFRKKGAGILRAELMVGINSQYHYVCSNECYYQFKNNIVK